MLLVESIRAFGRSLAHQPIWCLLPENEGFPRLWRSRLDDLGVELIPYRPNAEAGDFFFSREVAALAVAEARAEGATSILCWMDRGTVMLGEPADFLLPGRFGLAYRPVHHALIASRYNEPLDPFWSRIYRECQVPQERVFPMKTHVETTRIRPYLNAGILVTRPERCLFRTWREEFFRLYRQTAFEEFYRNDRRYEIFMHQAVLSGLVLREFLPDQLLELPPSYNYPLHLFTEDATEGRPGKLEDLVTFRHEGFFTEPEWSEKLPAKRPLKDWLSNVLAG
jgi:hypothetical protein